jgi:hypothetical protein
VNQKNIFLGRNTQTLDGLQTPLVKTMPDQVWLSVALFFYVDAK